MKNKKKLVVNVLYKVLGTITLLLFVLGGLGIDRWFVEIAGFILSFMFLSFAIFEKRELVLPDGFLLFTSFLVLVCINLFWSRDYSATLEFLMLFASGGFFWLAFYNLQGRLEGTFSKMVIILGFIFGALFTYQQIVNPQKIISWSLYTLNSTYENHNHIGDLWAVVLIVGLPAIFKRKVRYWIVITIAAFFLWVSLSRAAYVSVFIGALFYLHKKNLLEKYRKYFWTALFVIILLFLYAGSKKSIILSRPYFIQAVLGLLEYPLGVGLGNFEYISDQYRNILGGDYFSILSHNIILEIVTGIGYFAIVFLAWLYIVFQSLWEDSENVVYKAVFLTLLANFFFGMTYYVPTMMWLWFASLGLAQTRT